MDSSQIDHDHGAEVAEAAAEGLPPIADGVPLETQLRQARRQVCVPGKANPACAALVEMSLRLAADPVAEAAIREEYEALRQSMADAPPVASPAGE